MQREFHLHAGAHLSLLAMLTSECGGVRNALVPCSTAADASHRRVACRVLPLPNACPLSLWLGSAVLAFHPRPAHSLSATPCIRRLQVTSRTWIGTARSCPPLTCPASPSWTRPCCARWAPCTQFAAGWLCNQADVGSALLSLGFCGASLNGALCLSHLCTGHG